MIIKTRKGFNGRTIERVRHEAFSYRAWSYVNQSGLTPTLETTLSDASGNEYRVAMTKHDIQLLIEAYNRHNNLEGM